MGVKDALSKAMLKGAAAIGSIRAFDGGLASRRLKLVNTSSRAINSLVSTYGRQVRARARYLCANNPYAAAAKRVWVSGMIGDGIKPNPVTDGDTELKAELKRKWAEWSEYCDFDERLDFYGIQAMVAGELFAAGECFIRMLPADGPELLEGDVPLTLQVLPSEMLDLADNSNGRKMGIEFDGRGKRVAYWFYKSHPNDSTQSGTGEKVRVPAEEVVHIYDCMEPGQIRGVPVMVSSIVAMAMVDLYDDAETERKRTAALFAAFVTRPEIGQGNYPLEGVNFEADSSLAEDAIGLEPGAVVELKPGESVEFSKPADVGGSYEVFIYRQLSKVAAGIGVPYAYMSADLKQVNYSSMRAGLIDFRRRVSAFQKQVLVHQLCKRIRNRWMTDAVMSQAVSISPAEYASNMRQFMRCDWIATRWEWLDPVKDLQGEVLAVDNLLKPRSQVVESLGLDAEESDARAAEDKRRAEELGLSSTAAAPMPIDDTGPEDEGQDDTDEQSMDEVDDEQQEA